MTDRVLIRTEIKKVRAAIRASAHRLQDAGVSDDVIIEEMQLALEAEINGDADSD